MCRGPLCNSIFAGWNCTNPPLNTDPTVCVEFCGDGLQVGTEVCDDDVVTDLTDGIGCAAGCRAFILGWNCVGGSNTSVSVCSPICDDGLLRGSENCDDQIAPNVAQWRCNSNCIDNWDGWYCTPLTEPSVCTEICGDGRLAGIETCDDDFELDGEGCNPNCIGPIPGWNCVGGSYTGPATVCNEILNDGILVGNEICDDGPAPDQDGWGCFPDSSDQFAGWLCFNQTTAPGGVGPTVCSEICGDGLKVGNEVCDDGIKNDNNGCKLNCDGVINGWDCQGGNNLTKTICVEICNDGVSVGRESCDDGKGDEWGCK